MESKITVPMDFEANMQLFGDDEGRVKMTLDIAVVIEDPDKAQKILQTFLALPEEEQKALSSFLTETVGRRAVVPWVMGILTDQWPPDILRIKEGLVSGGTK